MDTFRAALLLQGHQFSPEAMIFFTVLVALWAVARPTTIRDADNRPLPPNLTARLIIVLLYAMVYAGVVAAFMFGKGFVMNVISAAPNQIEAAFKSFEHQSPLLALMALVGLQSLAPFREAERAFIVWIHSVRHLHGDVSTLVAHFQSCGFTPSDVEHQKNIDELARHNIFLTDPNTRGIDLPSLHAWRKLTTMLRRLRAWNKDKQRILTDAQMELLDELEKAHARKNSFGGGDPATAAACFCRQRRQGNLEPAVGAAGRSITFRSKLSSRRGAETQRPARRRRAGPEHTRATQFDRASDISFPDRWIFPG